MTTFSASPGTCYSCGYDLVQTYRDGEVERTYHPHNSLPLRFDCPALLPLGIPGHKSLNVPNDRFLSKDEDRKLTESLNRMEKES